MTEYFNKSEFKQKRKDLRNNPTLAEKLLWDMLKGKKLNGNKFRRQYGVGRYVVDFYCVKKKLGIETDGGIQDTEESKMYDEERSEFLRNFGIRILRIRNEDVENNIEEVCQFILRELGEFS